jgi:diaminopimelate decarboxylase
MKGRSAVSIRYTAVIGFARDPRHDNELVCDGVPLSAIAASEGTPLYVYSAAAFRARYRAIDAAFGDYPHALHYALKANSTLAVARLMRQLGSAADANSIWEIELARKAGFQPADIVFTGVGKSSAELDCAVPLGLKAINVESPGELARIESIAERIGRVTRVAIRINPDIDANSHPHISTGSRHNKFGMTLEALRELVPGLAARRALKLVAVHVHVGSQITTLEPLRRAAAFVVSVATELRSSGVFVEYVDLGGGLGISYDGSPAPSAEEYVTALVGEVRDSRLPIVIEPGRTIAGPAGVLVARVIDIKPRDEASDFLILDAGMTELLRPALYGAFHDIEPVRGGRGTDVGQYEIVGPVCESSDVVGRDRRLPRLAVGDLVAIRDTGAYGSSMASNYNRRPLPPEVLVDEARWRVIRRRQTIDDMLAMES